MIARRRTVCSDASRSVLALFLLSLQSMSTGVAASAATTAATSFQLNLRCPPSFELLPDGTCQFLSLYDLYASADGHGGLRARLPQMPARYRPAQIDLGRYLFFDRVLSGDGRVSCADCHDPKRGFSDGEARSLGFAPAAHGEPRDSRRALERGAPTLWNVGFLPRLFWDGRASSLAQQARGPLFAPDEMAATPEGVVAALNAVPDYRRLFAEAYSRERAQPISLDEIVTALAAFQSSLVSFNSRYDRYAFGDASALTELELQGYNVFRGFVARCSQCHIPPLFTDGELAVIGAPGVSGEPYDLGAGRDRNDPALAGAFRTPTLRNVARTAPYFNAGQFVTLEEVVAFYNDARGHAAPPGIPLQIHWHVAMTAPALSPDDVRAIVAFLDTLTDESLRPAIPTAVPSGLPIDRTALETASAAMPAPQTSQEPCHRCPH